MESRFLYLSLALSITGLLLMAYITETIEPPLSECINIGASSLGKNVHLKGNITEIHRFKGGSITFSLADDTGENKIYLPYSSASCFGDELKINSSIELIGVVELYEGGLEVVVENENALRVL
ncbi:MAG: hypothetical protein B6U97_00605 [Candidatus Altiarchaeales archaeon ex4484_96]|nr:MAG: hypothetical protein B6U97_00605 [Candidatus Altiarchaeales archaeon ex4484_96]